MKIKKFLIPVLLVSLALTSCKKQNTTIKSNDSGEFKVPSTGAILQEAVISDDTTLAADKEPAEEAATDKPMTIIPGNDGQPDEADIASGNKIVIEKWFSNFLSSDGKYYIRESGEYYYIYNRYCIPAEGERSELNLIMLKEDCSLYDPNDMGSTKKNVCAPGCEFVPFARSKEQISFNEQTSYWFRVTEKEWVPGSAVYIQPGAFEKLPVEDLEVGMAYEKINDGAWFVVKTDDGSALRLRDSSNIKTGNVITSFPQGTWIYADSQTTKTEIIDGLEARWYKTAYPEKGYVFGGYLEKQDGVGGLRFASIDLTSYSYDKNTDCIYKVFSAPTEKSEFLGEYEVQPDEYGHYPAYIETKELETVNGVQGLWIHINEPVNGFIFGHNFIYK